MLPLEQGQTNNSNNLIANQRVHMNKSLLKCELNQCARASATLILLIALLSNKTTCSVAFLCKTISSEATGQIRCLGLITKVAAWNNSRMEHSNRYLGVQEALDLAGMTSWVASVTCNQNKEDYPRSLRSITGLGARCFSRIRKKTTTINQATVIRW